MRLGLDEIGVDGALKEGAVKDDVVALLGAGVIVPSRPELKLTGVLLIDEDGLRTGGVTSEDGVTSDGVA